MLAFPLQHMLRFGEHQRVWLAPFSILGDLKTSLQRLREQSDYSGVQWWLSFQEYEFGFEHCSLGWVGFKNLGGLLYLAPVLSKGIAWLAC